MAQVARTGAESEALRQATVGQILEMPERMARAELYRTQARHAAGEPALKLELERIKQAKTPEETGKILAETYRALAAGDLDTAQAGQITKLLELKAEAQRLGNEKLEQDINNKLEMTLPGVGTAKFDPDVMARVLGGIEETKIRGSDNITREKFTTQQEQTAVDIDTIIQKDPKSAEAVARYQDFNRYSNRPKIAVKSGNKVEFIPLPRVGGKTITAKQVHDAAAELGMTVDELNMLATEAGIGPIEMLQQLAIKRQKVGK